MFPISRQRVYTMARRTPMETCGTQFWGKSWNASFALVSMASRTVNASRAPANTHVSILWNQQESAVRLVQVVQHGWWASIHDADWLWNSLNVASVFVFFFCLESKAESNQTQCYHKNNVLVYKVESSLKVDSPNTVRIIAVERPSTAEVEVQMWKAVEGT